MSISEETLNIKKLTVGGNDLKKLTEVLTYNSAWTHNALYRGKNLGTAPTAEQLAAIRNGTFADIYPGDYWEKNGKKYPVLGCNVYDWQYVDYSVTPQEYAVGIGNHVAVMFWKTNVLLNEEADTSGGLAGLDLHTKRFPEWLAELETIFGADNIKYYPTYITDATDSSGKPTHFIPSREKIFITTTGEQWGISFENSCYQGHKMQFPYYRHNSSMKYVATQAFWSDVFGNDNTIGRYGAYGTHLAYFTSVTFATSPIKCHFLLG